MVSPNPFETARNTRLDWTMEKAWEGTTVSKRHREGGERWETGEAAAYGGKGCGDVVAVDPLAELDADEDADEDGDQRKTQSEGRGDEDDATLVGRRDDAQRRRLPRQQRGGVVGRRHCVDAGVDEENGSSPLGTLVRTKTDDKKRGGDGGLYRPRSQVADRVADNRRSRGPIYISTEYSTVQQRLRPPLAFLFFLASNLSQN